VDTFVAGNPLAGGATTTVILSPDRSSGSQNFPNTPVNVIRFISYMSLNQDLGVRLIFQWGTYVANQNSVIANPANPFSDLVPWVQLDAIVGTNPLDEGVVRRYDTRVQRKLQGQEQALVTTFQNLSSNAVVFDYWTRTLYRLDPP